MQQVMPSKSEIADLQQFDIFNGSIMFNEYLIYRSQDSLSHYEALRLVIDRANSQPPAIRKILTGVGGTLN